MTPKEKADDIMQKSILTHVLAISNTKGKLISPYVSNYAYSIHLRYSSRIHVQTSQDKSNGRSIVFSRGYRLSFFRYI